MFDALAVKDMSMDRFEACEVAMRLEPVAAPPAAVEAIRSLLCAEAWLRPTAAEFLRLPWFMDTVPWGQGVFLPPVAANSPTASQGSEC